MDVNGVGHTTSASSQAGNSNELTGEDFMRLLIAQLKAQDPLNPVDASQFVGQLVQFNTLDQIIKIRQAVEANPAALNPADNQINTQISETT